MPRCRERAIRRWSERATRRRGDAAQEPGNGRAKNSARPSFDSYTTSIRAGFEPRDGLRYPPRKPNGVQFLTKVRGSRRHDTGSKPSRNSANSNNTIGAPSFSPYRSWFQRHRINHPPSPPRPFAVSSFRRVAPKSGQQLSRQNPWEIC